MDEEDDELLLGVPRASPAGGPFFTQRRSLALALYSETSIILLVSWV